MSDVILLDENGVEQTYSDVDTVLLNTTDGGTATYVSEHLIQNQVQADWNQTDDTQPDYIKNKPEAFESEPELPKVSEADNGKVLGVANGIWQKITLSVNGEGGSIASVQADWNQTDSSQPDYIKNKPFYEYEGEVDIFPLTRCENFTLNSAVGVNAYAYVVESYGCIFTVGESYKVSWDGVEYTCEALDVSSMWQGMPIVAFGNGTAFGMSGNNEPFIVMCNNLNGYLIFVCLQHSEPCSHDVRIYQEKMLAKTIDKKFIPIPFFGEENSTILECEFQNTLYDSDGDGVNDSWETLMVIEDASEATLEIGEKYTVTWDNTEYEAECANYMGLPFIGNELAFEGEDNGLPFFIIRDVTGAMDGTSCWVAGVVSPPDITASGLYSCKIEGLAIKKVDTKYLYQPNWNENDTTSGSYIANKPFSEIPAGTVIVPETTVNCTTPMSDNYYGIVQTIGLNNYTYEVEFNGVVYTLTSSTNSNGTISVVYEDDTIYFCIADNYAGSGMSIVLSSLGGENTYKITLAEDVVQKLDSKYLPDDIGGSSLPEVTTNNNGQVMTVVDGVWTAQTPAGGLPEVTSSDNDKVLTVINGTWVAKTVTHPVELPSVTVDDAGKFLRVSADGAWVAETIPNAEEASF